MRRWLTRKEWKWSPLEDLGFLKIRVFSFSVWSTIVATRICSEYVDCLGSTTEVGTGGDTGLEVRVLLSCVHMLLERTLVNRTYQLTRTLLCLAWAETVESPSSTVEDGGRERLWSGCEPKAVSADQIHPLKVHEASELTKLQAASYVGVR